jgi:MFS family permease
MLSSVTFNQSASEKTAQFSTRFAFFISGFCMASWAPLVPLVKVHTGVDEGVLGFLLLCLGGGSITAMPISGYLVGRYAAFAATMTIARLTGDSVISRFGAIRVLAVGSVCASLGVAFSLCSSGWSLALLGYALVGAGGRKYCSCLVYGGCSSNRYATSLRCSCNDYIGLCRRIDWASVHWVCCPCQ